MKTVALVTYWFPPDVGACPNRMGDLVEELPRHGLKPAVLVRAAWSGDREAHGCHPMARGLGPVAVARWLRSCRPDVAIVTVPPWHEVWPAWLACRMMRVPTVLDVRDPWSLVEERLRAGQRGIRMKAKLYAAAERVMCSGSAAVVVNSQGLLRYLSVLDGRPKPQVWFVPNAHRLDAVVPRSSALRQALGLEGRYVILYAGAMGAAQGMELVFASISPHIGRLRAMNVAFVFLGGRERASRELALMAQQHGLEGVAFFHAAVPRETAMAAMADADAGLIALSEGFDYAMPSKLFDALGFGKPVLAHVPPTSTAAWFVDEHGVGVHFYGPERLLPAVCGVMERGAEMGEAGRRLVAEEYNRSATVGRLAAHLHGLLNHTCPESAPMGGGTA